MVNEQIVTDHKVARGSVEKSVCSLLRSLASSVPSDRKIVELGSFRGRSTGYLALGASEGEGAQVVAVDPWDLRSVDAWPEDYPDKHVASGTYREARADFEAHLAAAGIRTAVRGSAPVLARRGYAAGVGKSWSQGQTVGLLFHDAEHSADAVEADLRAWEPHLTDDAVVVLHDAGNPGFAVEEGAQRVLDAPGWDWSGRELRRWRKHPERRGALVVRRRS